MSNPLPPLPPGFTLDGQGGHPPLPPGFTLDAPQEPEPERSILASKPVPHTGYAGQVRAMEGGPGPAPEPQAMADIGQSYVDIGKGAAVGVPSGAVGLPGDLEGVVRAVLAKMGVPVSTETALPTSEGVGNFIAGEPTNQDEAAGRFVGALAGPGIGVKALKVGAGALGRSVAGAGPTEAAKAAHGAGYKLPPAMVSEKPGIVSQVLGLSGKIKLQQAASAKNQEVTNRLASQALGLPEGAPITQESLKAVRAVANKAYADVAKSVDEISADEAFGKDIGGLGRRRSASAKAFPGLVRNDEIENLVDTLNGAKSFSPEAGIELVRDLRADAAANLKAFSDPGKVALGKAQRQAAEAVDNLIERNLTSMGKPDLVHAYRDARQQLARTYDVESALDPAGNVSAKTLASRLKKGRPLSGPLKDIAETGRNFPKAMQNPSQFGGAESLSVIDLGAAGLSGGATIPLSLARPGARSALLSSGYQNMLMRSPGAPTPVNPFTNVLALPNALGPENAFNRPVQRAK